MTLPAALQTVEVTATKLYPDGAGMKGRITFSPSPGTLTSADEDVLVGGPVVMVFDGTGAPVTAELLATDSTGVIPTDWTYRVEEKWNNAPSRSYSIALPAANPAVDLADIAPTDPAAGDLPSASSFGQELVSSADAPAARTTLGAETAGAAAAAQAAAIAASQPLDSDLTAIAALSTTTYGRSLLTAADAAGARASLNVLPPRGNGFVALGDSLSTASGLGAGGAGYGQAWAHMVPVLSMQRLNYLGNAGVTGQTSTQIAARVADVVALGPQVVTVLAGTNDLAQAVSFAAWSSNIKTIAATLRAAGIRVVLCTIPPRGNTTYLANTLIWNAWLRTWAGQNAYDLVDFFDLLTDGATGMFASGYDSGDTVHPSAAAHVAMTELVIAQLADIPAFKPLHARTATDASNLLSNPLLTAGASTPTGWTAGGTVTTGYTEGFQTDADFAGRAWEWDFTAASPASGYRSLASPSISSSSFTPGETMLFTAKAKVVTSSGLTPGVLSGLVFKPLFFSGSTPSVNLINGHSAVTPAGLYWFKQVVPSGTTSIQLYVFAYPFSGSAQFKARVGQIGAYNLTRMGLDPAS